MDILLLLVFIYISMSVTWVLYLAVMSIKMERDELKAKGKSFTWQQKIFGYPTVAVMLLADVVFNVTVGSLLFLEPPTQLLFTSRCQKHMHRKDFRGRLARSFCKYLLDPFEIGGHC